MDARLKGDRFARGAADIRIEPHYRHDGWIRESRYEGDWLMNDRIHFGAAVVGGELRFDYHWSSENLERSGPVEQEMFFELPASASRYFKGGSLRVLFDEWN
jgi:hypothetical protein